MENKPVFITRSELCQRWKLSSMTLRRKEKSGDITPIKLSPKTVMYRMSEIEKIEKESEVKI